MPFISEAFDPSAAVDSVFGRSGAVTAATGDYTAAQVTNAADKASASVQTFTGGLNAASLGATIHYVTVQTGAPTVYQTPLVYDDTAVSGGLYAWTGAAYSKVGGLAS
jgi:hypothetical protein